MITNKIVPFVPKSVDFSNFADKNYWLERYENTKNTSEWYDDYETIKPLIYQLNISKRSVKYIKYYSSCRNRKFRIQ